MSETLGSELRRARTAAGLKLRGVETATGISNAYLSQLETGKAENPTLVVLNKLAALYKIRAETLLAAAGYPTESPKRDIFLSHSSKDKSVVRELAAAIESEFYEGRPFATWIDEAEIRPGESIPGKVTEGLEKVDSLQS